MNLEFVKLTTIRSLAIALVCTHFACGATIQVPQDYGTIQAALDTATDGDVILVGPGTYVEIFSFTGKAVTIQSVEGPDTTIIEGAVGFLDNEGPDSILIGFTIAPDATPAGVGISCIDSSPTIQGNIIQGHEISGGGGAGIHINGKSPFDPFGPRVFNNIIRDNHVQPGGGGGILVRETAAIIEGNMIAENSASWDPSPTQQPNGGGVLFLLDQGSIFNNNLVIGNSQLNFGGGGGVAFSFSQTLIEFRNNTIVGNYSEGAGGGIFCDQCFNLLIENCIVYGNSDDLGWGPQIYDPLTVPGLALRFCDVEAGWPGTGNIDADPQFVVGPGGEYYLAPTSPCVDAGDPTLPIPTGFTSIDQTPDTPPADMGYHHAYVAPPDFRRGDANADGSVDVGDAVFTLMALFVPGSGSVSCADSGDVNDDGVLNIGDPIYLLSALFVALSPAPSAPYPDCGADPTPDGLPNCGSTLCP